MFASSLARRAATLLTVVTAAACGSAGAGTPAVTSSSAAATPTASPTPAAQTALPVVFSDPLTTATAGNLPVQASFSGASGSTGYQGGAYRVTDASSGFEIFEGAKAVHNITDTDVSVDATLTESGASDSRGLFCRGGAGQSAAFYALYFSADYFLIIYDAPNNEAVLAKVPNTRFTSTGGTLHVEAICTGSGPVHLALYVNGAEVASATDSGGTQLTRGDAGIFVRNDSGGTEVVDFRNLEIRGS